MVYMLPLSVFGLGIGYIAVINWFLKSKLADKYVCIAGLRTWAFATLSGFFFGSKMYDFIDLLAIYVVIVSSVFLYLEHERRKGMWNKADTR